VGKVKNDRLGQSFAADMRNIGVHFDTAMAGSGLPTACCIIGVTPDGHRSMNTYLGACTRLGPTDVDTKVVAAAPGTYVAGYLWDEPEAKKAVLKAFDAAHAAARQEGVALAHRAVGLQEVRLEVDVKQVAGDAFDGVAERQHVDLLAVLDVGALVHGHDVAQADAQVLADHLVHQDVTVIGVCFFVDQRDANRLFTLLALEDHRVALEDLEFVHFGLSHLYN